MAKKSSSGTPTIEATRSGSKKKLSYADLQADGVNMVQVIADFLTVHGADGIRALAASLNRMDVPDNHFDTVENLVAMEETKSALVAKQVDHAVAYEDALSLDRQSRRVREKNPGWGASKEIALALRLSPKRGTEFTNSSRILEDDLPQTLQGLRAGKLTWVQAQVVISGTRHLQQENRRLIDQLLWEEVNSCFDQGTALLTSVISYWALLLEPQTEEDLEDKAWKNRHIGGYQINAHEILISGTFPLSMGAAILQVLAREKAKAQKQTDEKRNAGQIQADAFYGLITGAHPGRKTRLEILLVMDAAVLAGQSDEPVMIPGYGMISAKRARELIAEDPEDQLATWVRGIYVNSRTGRLMAMESQARRFTGNLKKLIKARDQYCRTPYCNGKIQDMDHVVQVRKNGKTTEANSSSRCAGCNQTKEAPGWEEKPIKGQRHTFKITTPSGHTYISKAPPLPGIKIEGYPKRKQEGNPPGGSPPGNP
ncbi:HNH endonuclease [Arthrobacter sp. MYb227]|uniref:DUF222 domain-containing protein n=1 Tax=Arthrobacter sp. MYb227 TaxID=1848601 RepID=UPI000CFB6C28|nr:DUF222 domain-containing protein [Arthrobacter sp. MYb227]PQZ92329.1 HNH endonuclease [Arthrobacter sp. MYb227]